MAKKNVQNRSQKRQKEPKMVINEWALGMS